MEKFSATMNIIAKMWEKLNGEEKSVLAMLIAGITDK